MPRNRALAVARKFVAYLVAVDRSQKDFLVIENQTRCVKRLRRIRRVYSARSLLGLAVKPTG